MASAMTASSSLMKGEDIVEILDSSTIKEIEFWMAKGQRYLKRDQSPPVAWLTAPGMEKKLQENLQTELSHKDRLTFP